MKLLVANRGEIAVRILRAAGELGIDTVAIASEDDAASPHLLAAGQEQMLPGKGPAAYLDAEAVIAAAKRCEADAIHPGCGFLSESPSFARACEDAAIRFVGPRVDTLEVLGDKLRARDFAERLGIPVLPVARDAGAARALLASQGPTAALMVKAAAGGGGRGLRRVAAAEDLDSAWRRCASEAGKAFGSEEVYAERYRPGSRHVEVQVLGDGSGTVIHFFDRECSLQRRYQKLVEMAPSPSLSESVRAALTDAALRMANELAYRSLGTFEFLVGAALGDDPEWFFLEANPRLQVEHTVTEAVTGVDLVRAQLRLAGGASLEELGLHRQDAIVLRGCAVQARVTTETIGADGSLRPSSGRLNLYEPPCGAGIRVDGYARAGSELNPRFDSLLAKVVAWDPEPDIAGALLRVRRAVSEFRVDGVATNLPFLKGLLAHPEVAAGRISTSFVEEHLSELASHAESGDRQDAPSARLAGARLASEDPLAVLEYGKGAALAGSARQRPQTTEARAPAVGAAEGAAAVVAHLQGTVVSLEVAAGDVVSSGQPLLVLEAMKMEHVVVADCDGVVLSVTVEEGDTVAEGAALLFIEPGEVQGTGAEERAAAVDLEAIRGDLAELNERHGFGMDAARPEAVARRRATGQRSVRENIEDLCDPGSLVEYGPLVIAAQRARRSTDELMRATPADGLVGGLATVNAALFGEEGARCVVMSYDYTVLAGTQGQQNHRKKDRLFELAERWRLPLVLFTEGGGGRPGDTDTPNIAGLDCLAFHYFGRLSGLVPLVAINSGRCFAGNAALFGCSDVTIATENSTIGMGGPAMIEGGGLGIFRPEEVGPIEVHRRNGVVDIVVADEAQAVAAAKRYLSYFQGTLNDWECVDQRLLRPAIPENRLRVYNVRKLIEELCDTASLLELRPDFGRGMVTGLARIEGRPIGIVANNPLHLGGAIDSDGADKAARFMKLCDSFDLPLLFLCDTPGIMVGPEAEKSGTVRHAARMFVVGANLSVPVITVILRKGYGLGAQAMAGGSFRAPALTVSWPTGEFGGMGLEGAVKLALRKELAAEKDPEKRRAFFEQVVAHMYEQGRAVNAATYFEFDDVIDPADTRRCIMRALRCAPPSRRRTEKKRPSIDTW